MFLFGSKLIKLDNNRDGIVIFPSFIVLLKIHQLIPISKSVAAKFKKFLLVDIKTLFKIGKVSDFEEIKQGTNPNCLGNNCNIEPEAMVQGGEESADIVALNNGITEISPSYLRTLLEKSGIASSYIQQLTDKEILEVYYATVPPGTQINPPASNTNVSNTNTAAPQGQDIQQMSPQELRSFLIKSGMSKEMLDNFSDDEILQVLKETTSQ